MAGDTTITIVGNLTADPELRFTRPVRPWRISPWRQRPGSMTVRPANGKTAKRCSSGAISGGRRPRTWPRASPGARVIVSGRLKQRSFETREGEKRTVIEVEVDEIGPSLRYATAKVNKASRSGRFGSGSRPAPAQTSSASGDDPWGSAPASGSFGGGDDEPPF